MNIEKKNLPESVYSRLKNIALAKNRPTQEVLRYYLDFVQFYVLLADARQP